jgi:pyruvate dehydrogenase E1 component alpha subunit
MLVIRKLEATNRGLYNEGLIRGFCHLYSGEEAVAVGMKAALSPQDSVITSFREHGWAYMMGISPFAILAELLGKEHGCSRGKGGSMHMYTKNYYGGNGIVGAQVPLGAGMALMHQYHKTGGVAVALFGDGASNQGQVFEAYNMAKLWKLPCIFVCENNGFGMGTAIERSSSNVKVFEKGDVVPGIWVDGMDVLAVREATRVARKMCVEGQGPVLIEADTFLFLGHSLRSRVDHQQVRQHADPIKMMYDRMFTQSLATHKEMDKMGRDVHEQILKAVQQAKDDKEIEINEIGADIYTENLEGPIRGVTYDQSWPHINVGKTWRTAI